MKTGFAGLGNLGKAMAKRLLSEGVELTVWNRTAEKAEGLDAEAAASPASLISGVDILVVNLKTLSRQTRIGQFAITSFLLALATSLPELVVGVTAALEGKPNLALGNVLGSNIADMSLVIGGAALVSGVVVVKGVFLRRDVFYAF